MAWFITFHEEIPAGLSPKERNRYDIRSYPIDSSHPRDLIEPTEEEIAQACAQFAKDQGVDNWEEKASGFNLSELNYD